VSFLVKTNWTLQIEKEEIQISKLDYCNWFKKVMESEDKQRDKSYSQEEKE
jgi:hypothetical protein